MCTLFCQVYWRKITCVCLAFVCRLFQCTRRLFLENKHLKWPSANRGLLLLLSSCWVTSDSLRPHGLWHTSLACPALSPGVCSHSCPLNQWCYITISSSAAPFPFCLQSFPASGSFPMSQLFTSGGQSIGPSGSDQSFQWIFRTDFLRVDWIDLFAVQGTLKSLLQHHNSKTSILWHSAFL